MSEILGTLMLKMGLKEIRYRMIMVTLCGFGIGLGCGALLLYFLQGVKLW